MTLRELKEKKHIPSNIKDNELISICNQVLKLNPEAKTMDYNIQDKGMINKLIYSKQIIETYISKILSAKTYSKSYNYEIALKGLNVYLSNMKKIKGFDSEIEYVTKTIKKLESEKKLFDSVIATFESHKDSLVNINQNSVKKLNKEALSTLMFSLVGNLEQMKTTILEENKQLKERIAKLEEELKEKETQTVHKDINDGGMQAFVKEEAKPSKITPATITTEVGEMKPLIPANSLHDLKNRGIIPKNIKEKELIDYCNNVLQFNPKVTNMNYVLDDKKIEILSKSKIIQDAKTQIGVVNKHTQIIKKYTQLIEGYENVLANINKTPDFDNERKKITDLIKKLKKEKHQYVSRLKGFDTLNKSQYFEFGVSTNENISKGVKTVSSQLASVQDEKLKELDMKLSNLLQKRDNIEKVDAKYIIGKTKKDIDIKLLNARINRIRKKQGILKTTQKKIIDVNTKLYMDKMNRKFKKYSKEQEHMKFTIASKENTLINLNEKQERLNALNKKIKQLEGKKQKNVVSQTVVNAKQKAFQSEKKYLESKIGELRKKVGNVDITKQYSKAFNRDYSYAL